MSARPVVRGLHHIKISGSDLERSTAWYRSVLDPATVGRLAGCDPLTFTVTDRTELDGWIGHLDTPGVPHSPVIVALVGYLLVVPDPDVVRLRFYTDESYGLGATRWTSRPPGCAPTPCPPRTPDRR
ncbi:VOC family protein [Streptomyces sp. NPDC051987]|uniref:VOC family protein n=1 Tax=Streptomyces sp. NPDC051987 TaxID=3155808 RepID=UPI003420A5EF